MADMHRREVLELLAVAPLAAAFDWGPEAIDRAGRLARGVPRGQGFQPRFFTPHEWETVRLLVDVIIPRDERSGGATDAGVPEFMDFIMLDGDDTARQTAMRGGLAWLDIECRERFGNDFVGCQEGQRSALLDLIAWPDRAPEELRHGVAFFTSFRNLTATGFWSSRMGIQDLQYMGNTAIAEWDGCPAEQRRRLGLHED